MEGKKLEFEYWECHFEHFWCCNGENKNKLWFYHCENIEFLFKHSMLKNENRWEYEAEKWTQTVSLQQDC